MNEIITLDETALGPLSSGRGCALARSTAGTPAVTDAGAILGCSSGPSSGWRLPKATAIAHPGAAALLEERGAWLDGDDVGVKVDL
jgi:hypothetical protein